MAKCVTDEMLDRVNKLLSVPAGRQHVDDLTKLKEDLELLRVKSAENVTKITKDNILHPKTAMTIEMPSPYKAGTETFSSVNHAYNAIVAAENKKVVEGIDKVQKNYIMDVVLVAALAQNKEYAKALNEAEIGVVVVGKSNDVYTMYENAIIRYKQVKVEVQNKVDTTPVASTTEESKRLTRVEYNKEIEDTTDKLKDC